MPPASVAPGLTPLSDGDFPFWGRAPTTKVARPLIDLLRREPPPHSARRVKYCCSAFHGGKDGQLTYGDRDLAFRQFGSARDPGPSTDRVGPTSDDGRRGRQRKHGPVVVVGITTPPQREPAVASGTR